MHDRVQNNGDYNMDNSLDYYNDQDESKHVIEEGLKKTKSYWGNLRTYVRYFSVWILSLFILLRSSI